jgi:serine/threonine protein kinase
VKQNFAANSYVAPEQTAGHIGPSLDLFALGLVLLYLLTGQEPQAFYGTRNTGAGIAIPDLPGVAPDLLAILRKLTEPVPTQRYATAHEVAAALSQVKAQIGLGQRSAQ